MLNGDWREPAFEHYCYTDNCCNGQHKETCIDRIVPTLPQAVLNKNFDMVTIVNETRSSCAIDFNFRTGMIFWSDVMTRKIYRLVQNRQIAVLQ